MDLCCRCPNIGPQEIFNFCVQARHLLNFRACKLCLKEIPIDLQEHLISISEYFKSMPGRQPFFYYSGNARKVNISMDNPGEKYMINVKKVY